jgi:hypothetical protein
MYTGRILCISHLAVVDFTFYLLSGGGVVSGIKYITLYCSPPPLDGGKSIKRAIGREAPENRDFLGPEMAMSEIHVHKIINSCT